MIILKLLFIIHLLIWIFVTIGGIFNKTVNQFNLLILLPLIYISQSLSFHPIMYMKMKYIKDTNLYNAKKEYFNDSNLCDEEKDDMNRLSRLFNESYDKILEHYAIYIDNEDIISHNLRAIRKYCDKTCNKNPFSSQGLIIIAYIINVYIYYIHERL